MLPMLEQLLSTLHEWLVEQIVTWQPLRVLPLRLWC
jgi:hypothetical protein